MSESHCGSVAIEALVTVCRAMSQLEVGQFAVASFGGKGNIRLLHDFDQPFTGEAGVKNASQEAGGTTAADELKQALLRTTLELESTRVTAQEELRRMESQALHLSRLLEIATRERDEARHALLLLFLHHGDRPHLPSHHEPNLDPNTNPAHSLAFDEGSDVAAAAAAEDVDESSNGASPPALTAVAEVEAAAARRGLPEKGRLVEAVMGAGPLLQTLLLAGPLPQWRHPPPDLRSSEIPPVAISLNPNPKNEKDGEGSPSPLPASLRNSSSSSSSLESGSNCNFGSEFQNATFSLKSV
ncbi:hypothetical protein GW17_00013151 [Ensete ventricosum]|nr:hypothetical protein GW17_00013151 [Ensete ventricosum]RZS17210.1 hypothetical protein BHM03_00049329 [Ensete ventricosum]